MLTFTRSLLVAGFITAAVATPTSSAKGKPKGKPTAAGEAAAPTAAAKGTTEKFGQPLSGAQTLALAAVLDKPGEYAGKTVLVDGKVRAACTRKGCWMELAPSADKGAQGCRVRFKDYGFFVPTNSAGSVARVEGMVAVRTVPPAEVAHYESEGASFPKKAKDGSAIEVSMTATGVELSR